jgi:N-methylhydantoinase A
MLGYLHASSPLAGGVELDAEAARAAVGRLAGELGLSLGETAAGIVRVASAEMARAVRVMTVERGVDPRELALLAFGGAGPLHAATIAAELDMNRVLVPPSSGVLSAVGLIASEPRRDLVRSVLLSGAAFTPDAAAEAVESLACRGAHDLGDDAGAEVRVAYDLRYSGQAFELTIPGERRPDPAELRRAFDTAHEERYGYSDDAAELELVTVRVAVARAAVELPPGQPAAGEERGRREAVFEGERVEAVVVGGAPGRALDGPAIVELQEATLVVPPGWSCAPAADGTIVMERGAPG